ncbi:MAG TPA: hypothetical protein VM032_01980 [Vicinamibacterales bacterium]|nr:hypothetical protein [Vicinamibacterales bacterium]
MRVRRFRSLLVCAILTASSWAIGVPSAQAQTPYTVAEFAPGPSNQFGLTGFGSDFGRPGQTFTVTRDGKLHTIRVLLTQNGALPNAVTVEVRAVDQSSGLPTNSVLASAAIANPPLSSVPTYFTADFSAGNVLLRAGMKYAFSLRTHSPGAGAIAHGDSQSVTDPYAGGARVQSSDYGATWFAPGGNTDLAFRVMAVPPVVIAPDNTFGTGKLSIDLLSNLEWLSPTLTQGTSPEQITGGFGGYLASGVRFATTTEFEQLLNHFGVTDIGVGTASVAQVDSAQTAINILGATASSSSFGTTAGYSMHPTIAGAYTQSSIETYLTPDSCSGLGLPAPCARALAVNGTASPQQITSYVGAMLVRDTSSLDQAFYPFNFSAGDISTNAIQIGDGQSVAQTFAVGATGQLTRVSVQLGAFGTMTQPVRLEVRRTASGVPGADTEPALATALIPVAAAVAASSTSAFVTVSLGTAVPVTAGEVLAIVLSSEGEFELRLERVAVFHCDCAPPALSAWRAVLPRHRQPDVAAQRNGV